MVQIPVFTGRQLLVIPANLRQQLTLDDSQTVDTSSVIEGPLEIPHLRTEALTDARFPHVEGVCGTRLDERQDLLLRRQRHFHVRIHEHHPVALRLAPTTIALCTPLGSLLENGRSRAASQGLRLVSGRVVHDDNLRLAPLHKLPKGRNRTHDVTFLVPRRNDNRKLHHLSSSCAIPTGWSRSAS